MDSPAKQSSDRNKKLREEIIEIVKQTHKAACQSLLPRLMEKFADSEYDFMKEIKQEDVKYLLGRITLHDILIKGEEKENGLSDLFRPKI